MKRSILLIYALIIIATLTLGDDNIQKLADKMEMSRTEIKNCYNKMDMQPEDLLKIHRLIEDKYYKNQMSNSVTQIGCFFACLYQQKGIMSGAEINEDLIYVINGLTDFNNLRFINIYGRKWFCYNLKQGDECTIAMRLFMCTRSSIARGQRKIITHME